MTQTKGFWITSDETFSAGTEYFIGVSFSVTNNHYYVFRNGVIIEEGTLSDESRDAITGDLNIGRDNRDYRYWDGKIWDVRIYQNKALSVDEMRIIYYSRGNDNIVDGLVGRWLMDEKPDGTATSGANSVIDISGNGNHGTPYNSPVYRSAPVRLTNPQFN
ncbi:MAG: hypothetical protein JRI44_13990, partial [Deltaproteobacteria bacterium]|nr:hypothetical protein [Deltaproteobacteria bacterium]